MTKYVQTVTGPVPTTELGSALMHEHLFSSSFGFPCIYPQMFRPDYMEVVENDLRALKAEGIETVLDATPACLGRDVRGMKKASEDTGVNIIATSGWWGVNPPPFLGPAPLERWVQCFIDDMTKGCDGTDIKAGVLKAAMDKEGPTEWRKLTHRAVGMAAVETGANVILHTYCPMETPRHQLQLLKEVGVDMNRVLVGHILETTDMEFVKWIYDQGVWLGMDRLPLVTLPGEYGSSAQTRIRFMKAMIDEGMADRMLFSHDFISTSTLFDLQSEEVQAQLAEAYPHRFLFYKKVVFPKLAEMGVDPDYLWQLSIDNPRKFFEG